MLWWKLRGLKSRNASQRLDAIKRLFGIDEGAYSPDAHFHNVVRSLKPKAIVAIVVSVADSDDRVRYIAVKALRGLGAKEFVPVLVKTLDDSAIGVRLEAAKALGEIGDPGAAGPLIETLKYEKSKWAVRKALGQLGEQATPHLIAALKSPNCKVKVDVIKLIGEIKDARATPALVAACRESDIANHALLALERFGASALPSLIELLKQGPPSLRPEVAATLGRVGDRKAIPSLLAAIGASDARIVLAALHALNRLGYVFPNTSALRPALPVLQSALADPEPKTRIEALHHLERLLGTRAIPAIIRLCSDFDENVQKEATYALAELGDARAIEPLIHRLRKNSIPFHQQPDIIRLTALGTTAHQTGRTQEVFDEICHFRQEDQR